MTGEDDEGIADRTIALLQRVAAHFEGSDAPLGRDAVELLQEWTS